MNIKRFMTKKVIAVGLASGIMLGAGGAAFAYFTTSGSGSGNASVGTNTALVLHQDTITYSNSATDNILLPGTSATVTFTVDNPSSGQQLLNTISVSSITADADHAGCDTATHPTWFTTGTDVVNTDYAPGSGQAVSGSLDVTLNDVNAIQDVCKGATLTFHYTSN